MNTPALAFIKKKTTVKTSVSKRTKPGKHRRNKGNQERAEFPHGDLVFEMLPIITGINLDSGNGEGQDQSHLPTLDHVDARSLTPSPENALLYRERSNADSDFARLLASGHFAN